MPPSQELALPRCQPVAHGPALPLRQRFLQPRVIEWPNAWQHPTPVLEFLAGRYGDLELGNLGGTYGWAVRYEQRLAYRQLGVKSLREYVERFTAGDSELPYLRHLSVHRDTPEIGQHLSLPSEFGPNWVTSSWLDRFGGPELFLGQEGTGFGHLHQDHCSVHVGFVQLAGEKAFALFPPSDTPHLYTRPGDQFPYQPRNSRIREYKDLDDIDQFPLLAKATRHDLVLRAGQALLLPANWWHTTLNLTDSVSYSIRIVNSTNIIRCVGDHLGGAGRFLARARK